MKTSRTVRAVTRRRMRRPDPKRCGLERLRAGPALAVHFSSRTVEWATPPWLFEELHREFQFTLDPCASSTNAKCPKYFTRVEDGLAQDWSGEVVFMNPPYGREISLWMKKACESAKRGATVVCLVPSRTDTSWWHDYAMQGEVRFLRGRLTFGDARHPAPFPSAVVIFRPPRLCDTIKHQPSTL